MVWVVVTAFSLIVSLIITLIVALWYLLFHLALTTTLGLLFCIFLVMAWYCGFYPLYFPYYYPLVLFLSLDPHNHPRPFISGLFSCYGLLSGFLPLLFPFGTCSFTWPSQPHSASYFGSSFLSWVGVVDFALIISLTITLWCLLLHLALTMTLGLLSRFFFLVMGCCHDFYPYHSPLVLALSLGPCNHPRPICLASSLSWVGVMVLALIFSLTVTLWYLL